MQRGQYEIFNSWPRRRNGLLGGSAKRKCQNNWWCLSDRALLSLDVALIRQKQKCLARLDAKRSAIEKKLSFLGSDLRFIDPAHLVCNSRAAASCAITSIRIWILGLRHCLSFPSFRLHLADSDTRRLQSAGPIKAVSLYLNRKDCSGPWLNNLFFPSLLQQHQFLTFHF